MNVLIMRAFVRLREVLETHKNLKCKLEDLERQVSRHDRRIAAVFDAIKALIKPGDPIRPRRIGFQAGKKRER